MENIIAIQADSLNTLNPKSDTSLLIASELCKMKKKVFFYEPSELLMAQDDSYLAYGHFLDVTYKNHISEFSIVGTSIVPLEKASCIMIRQDPPFDINYITNTYIMEHLKKRGVKIVNDPVGIRSNSEKMAAFEFREFMPPSIVISSFKEMALDFVDQFAEVIIKPLYWFGGRFIEKISKNEDVQQRIEKALEKHKTIILQKFLPEICQGDKRVFIIDGKVCGCMKRIPAEGSFIANLAAGGRAAPSELTSKENEIAELVGGYLKKNGIIFAGLDMINDHLIEINVTSPTGLVAFEKLYGINLAKNITELLL